MIDNCYTKNVLLKILIILSCFNLPVNCFAVEISNIKLIKSEINKLETTKNTTLNKSTTKHEEVKTLSLKQVFNTKSEWFVTAYHLKEDDNNYFETSKLPAKLCFWTDIANKEHDCIGITNKEGKSSAYTEVISLSIISIQTNKEPYKGIIFIKAYRGPTVGAVYNVTIWAYDSVNDSFHNILSDVGLTSQSEYEIFPSMKNVNGGLFVIADRIWANNEKLYDPHKFKISIYNLTDSAIYKMIGQYITSKKYNSFFEENTKKVIESELSNIKKHISKYIFK